MGDSSVTLLGLLVAIAAGLLIGLEREHRTKALPGGFGGIRTFPLVSLSGALAGVFAQSLGPWPVVAVALVIGAFLVVSALRYSETGGGMTTEVAAFATLLLGGLATVPGLALPTTQRYLLVIAGAGVVMGLLSFKEPLHRVAARITSDDLFATAKFVLLAAVVLPLLPDIRMGPLGAWNPFNIGTMVVLVAAISFAGYVAGRLLGAERGLIATGIVGGLVSSTAVSVSLSQQVAVAPRMTRTAAAAIVVASSTMFLRVLVAVSVVAPDLVAVLARRMGVMAAVGVAGAAMLSFWRRARDKSSTSVELKNPFALKQAVQFGLLYGGVLFVVEATRRWLGDTGLYLTSLVAGTTDVDAITLSLSRLFREGLPATTAAAAITIAAMTNTVVKIGLSAYFGGQKLGIYLAAALGATLLAGGLSLLW